MKEGLDNIYLALSEPQQRTMLALRVIILGLDNKMSETNKYGMPCFLYHAHIMAYLWSDKKTGEPYILMAQGAQLIHPALEQGTRARMKILRIDPHADIPLHTIRAVFDQAIALMRFAYHDTRQCDNTN